MSNSSINEARKTSLDGKQELMRHTAFADMYTILALFLQVPTRDVVDRFSDPALVEDCRAIMLEMGQDTAVVEPILKDLVVLQADMENDPDTFGAIRREFTRLFSHPVAPTIQPYEGVFVDSELIREGKPSTEARLFVNPAAIDAERRYREAGLACSSDMSIPADCITTELEFLSYLHELEAYALFENASARAKEVCTWIDGFHASHSSRWFFRFFERCQAESMHGLYRVAGSMGIMLASAEGLSSSARLADQKHD